MNLLLPRRIIMQEVLKKLVETEILTVEQKEEISEAIKQEISEAVKKAEEETRVRVAEEVQVQLTEQWIKEKEELVEALEEKVGEFLKEELEQFTKDIDNFRDLEVEKAKDVERIEKNLVEQYENDMKELIEHLDRFISIQLDRELSEWKEEIKEVRQLEFGRKVFEGLEAEFRRLRKNDEFSLEARIERLEQENKDLHESQNVLMGERDKLVREKTTTRLLGHLSGIEKELMENLLRPIGTEDLEDAYTRYIPKVIKQASETGVISENASDEGNKKVLSEGKKQQVVLDENELLVLGDYDHNKGRKLTENEEKIDSSVKNEIEKFARLGRD